MAGKKAKNTIEDRTLCEGVVLSKGFFDKKENRLFTLLLKGYIVYLLSMGSIGFYLSALNIEYNVVMCHIVILGMAIICAMLYYRLLVENLGYLVLLLLFVGLVVLFRTYINSGFYAIVNITVDNVAQYFDVDVQRLYNEQIGNRYLTVTCVVLFIGTVLDILLNVYISRRMQYVTAIFIVMSLNLIPLYMVMEPDMLYVIMLLAGMAMAMSFKAGKHYSPQVSIKRDDRVFAVKGKNKQEISYVYDIKSMLQAGIIAACTAMVIVTMVSVVRPKDSFNVGYKGNKYKDLTMAAVSTVLVDGWSGFFRMTRDRGGMDRGRLGDVSTVHLDYQTDLMVQVTPYSYEPIYLKGFVGVKYNPYENNWTNIADVRDYDNFDIYAEARVLRKAYEAGNAYSSKGTIRIRNVDTSIDEIFSPYYYMYDTNYTSDMYDSITFYPRLNGNDTSVTYEDYPDGRAFTDEDLYVPDENIAAIEKVVDEIGYIGTDEQIIESLKRYYQENIPYTVRPGKTPKKKDFVNYFLTENRKGYCSYYASAAVLIFRYLGIPARYVEGYAIDYYQLLDGEIVENSVYSEFYDGYSELGETALIEVNVTDADAHAWVEVYDSMRGWYVVDVTPSASGDEEEIEDFWSMFADFMDDSNTGDGTGDGANQNNFRISDELIRNIIYCIFIILAAVVAAWLAMLGFRYVIFVIRYSRAGINDRLVMRYAMYRKRLARRDKEFVSKINYREQIEYLNNSLNNVTPYDSGTIIDIMEQAGFSDRNIDVNQYEQVIAWMKNMRHKKNSGNAKK